MLTAVKIILVIVLIVLAVVALIVWWLIRKFKSAIKEALDAKPLHPPCRVNPEPEPNPQWRNPEQIKQFSDEFLANGFTSLGAFTVPEVGGLQLAAFANEAESLYGVAYDHKKLPPNIDVVCRHEDGSDITVTNTTYGSAMDRPPTSPAIRLDGGGVREVLDALWKHPATSPRIPVKGGEFAARFKAAYAKEMNWRLKRGGATREEIRRQAEKGDHKLTDEQFEEVYNQQRETYVAELQAGCIAQYLDEQKPAPAEWDEIQHRVFAVPETMTGAEVREALELNCDLDEEQTHRLEQIKLTFGQTALDFMRQVMDGNVGALELKRLGSVQEPLPAEIFLVEARDDDERSDDED